MKKSLQPFLIPAESHVSDLGFKSSGSESAGETAACSFWSRGDRLISIQHLMSDDSGQFTLKPHTRSEHTFFVCLAGQFSLRQSGKTHVIQTGGAMASNAGVEHSFWVAAQPQGDEVIGLTFGPSILQWLAADFQLTFLNEKTALAFWGTLQSETLVRGAVAIKRELVGRTPGYKIAIETIAIRLLVELLREWPRHQIEIIPAKPAARLTLCEFLRACEFMRRRRKSAFRLSHLCQYLGISKERFTRLFLATTNDTPANFYNGLLLEQSRVLLHERDLFIKEIGFDLGFKTTSHFITSFRRTYGTTPQEYRRRGQL